MPAQNVPPAPVSTRAATSLRASSSSNAPAMPFATAPLTAFLASGRLIVMTATPSSTSVSTASDILTTSLGLEADAAVEPDGLGVHVVVLDERPHQVGELLRPPIRLGKTTGATSLALNSSASSLKP